ncbi:MAG TPA: hypothetical protein VJ833_07970 [Rhodanobacteraceae bacterium]|nr:hypothetical protein [Rhodanobacteraceae bacterium]
MNRAFLMLALGFCIAVACVPFALIAAESAPENNPGVAALEAKVTELERRLPHPELGQQMLELQIRHDRLWWAGDAGNWNLAYYMVSELGEALRGIEETNGNAPELQPEKLSEVMTAIMNPAIRNVQEALAKKDKAAFAGAYDRLSASCNACHAAAGVGFLHIQRPKTPLLDNLRYEPAATE